MTFRPAADSRIKAAHAMGYHQTDSHRADETCSHQRDVPSEGPFRTRVSETFWDIDLVRGPECRANLAHPRHGKLLSGLPETAVKMLVPCPPQPILIGSPFGLYTSDNCSPWLDKNFHPHFRSFV